MLSEGVTTGVKTKLSHPFTTLFFVYTVISVRFSNIGPFRLSGMIELHAASNGCRDKHNN